MPNYCDPETGICTPSSLQELGAIGKKQHDHQEIIYVGDPMCSWCWGISPDLIKLRDYFISEKIAYRVMVGGLRPGGGDPWNDQMKNFLRHHWEQVHQKSGQPFGYKLMDLEEFNYDTGPACRAVVAARPLVKEKEMEFFEAIQRKFYVESEDPKENDFYQSLCTEFEIDFDKFLFRFESEDVKRETMEEFQLNRQWGIQGYPTILLLNNDKLYMIAHGYVKFEEMRERIEHQLQASEAMEKKES
ncbi:MAG: DsbA family protein [Cyclobacteriaceae bacterium]